MKKLVAFLMVVATGVVYGTVTPAAAAACSGVTFGASFAASYACNDLGTPSGIPSPLGGINFLDNNTLLIGGSANSTSGAIYQITVTRDLQNHITGFSGSATLYAAATNIDGGVAFGPGGVLFFTGYSNNILGQIKPGSTSPDKIINLSSLIPPVASSVGTLTFVPPGFAGAGQFKIASYNASTWYTGTLTSDGSGTFNLSVVQNAAVSGLNGPEGIVYVRGSNPGFGGVDSLLISEYGGGKVDAWTSDGNGDPVAGTAKDFLTGLTGAEGAVIDPVTGDFLFSTFGGGNRVLVISGFQPPPVVCVTPPSGLAAWWPGDGNTNDISGNNNTGTLQGGATFASGKVGQAFSLNGTSAYVEFPDSASLSVTGALTIDAWVNPNNVASAQTIVSKYNTACPAPGTIQRSYDLELLTGGVVQFCVYNDQPDPNSYRCVLTGAGIPAGVFSHVAGTFDPATQQMKIFVNGVDTAAPLLAGSVTVNPIFDSDTPVRIGKVFCASEDDLFGGLIDEVEVFNRVLSAAEIAAIFNAGSAGKCKLVSPALQTSPNPASGPVGTTLNDQAVLSGGSSPSGTITFKLFSPSDPTCAGTAVFAQNVTVSGNATYSTSGGFVANVAGTWHWTADYSGDGNNSPVSSACAAEAVVISAPVTPTLGTTPTPASGTAGVTALNDQATLSGGSSPTGTITFRLFSPADPTCASGASFTQTLPVNGNATYSTSGGPVANVAGTWHWTATYSGDANNNAVSSACADESVVISAAGPVTPTLGTTPTPASGTLGLTPLNDRATLSGGASPTGTIIFRLFSPADPTCAGTAFFSQTVSVSGNGTVSTSGGPVANAVGTWYWTASYSGDANNNAVSSACAAEPVVISPAQTALIATALPTTGTVGETALNDRATLQGVNPTGTITFNLFSPADASCAGAPFFTQTVPVSGNGTVSTSGGPVANAAGTWHWTVSYSGDANNSPAGSTCGQPVVVSASGGPVPTLSEWGMIMMAAALAWFAMRRMRRAS